MTGARVKYTDITIRGQVFPTIRAAAAHFGLTYQAVRMAMVAGYLDRVGLGQGRPPAPMRVSIRGMVFETAADAAAYLGLKPNSVRTAIGRGTADRLGLPPRYRGPAKPCVIAGIEWPSRVAACRDLGLSHGFLWHVEHGGGQAARETLLRAVMAWQARHGGRTAANSGGGGSEHGRIRHAG